MGLDAFLNLISTICDVALTITAVIAILITLKQIQSKKKSDIKASYMCGMGFMPKNSDNDDYEVVVGININLRNIGLGPVYYENCGLIFVNDRKLSRKKNYPGIMAQKSIKQDISILQPGESEDESIYMLEDLLKIVNNEHKILDDAKVYINVSLCNGKELYYFTGDTYKVMLEKYEIVNERRKHDSISNQEKQ